MHCSYLMWRASVSAHRKEDWYSDYIWCYGHLYLRCWLHAGGVSCQRVLVIWALEWNQNPVFRYVHAGNVFIDIQLSIYTTYMM